jgi:hypothetical protein
MYNDWKRFYLFVAFDIILNNVGLHINTSEDYKLYVRKYGVYGGNVEITAISEIYKMSVNIYFVYARQITQPSTVAVCQFVTERNVEPVYVKFWTRWLL